MLSPNMLVCIQGEFPLNNSVHSNNKFLKNIFPAFFLVQTVTGLPREVSFIGAILKVTGICKYSWRMRKIRNSFCIITVPACIVEVL